MKANLQGKQKQANTEQDIKIFKKAAKPNGIEKMKFRKIRRGKRLSKTTGYIYIGRIPHGFYEDQMTGYFSQFGKVLSAYVPRSKKSGRSKGYGFVEFEDEEVAKIAAETMNNYLMFNKVLKCKYIPPEERKRHAFIRKTPIMNYKEMQRIKNNKRKREILTNLTLSDYQRKTEQKILEFKQFFEERGIDFNFKVNTGNCTNSDLSSENDSQTETEVEKNINKAQDEVEDEFGVLEIDESDTEIYFKTPPHVKKIIKKSSSASVTPSKNNLPKQAKPKVRNEKKLTLKESQLAVKQKEIAKKKVTRASKKASNRGKTLCEKLPDAKKAKTLRKGNKTLKNQRKLKSKNVADGAVTLKKKKNIKQNKITKLQSKKPLAGKLSGK